MFIPIQKTIFGLPKSKDIITFYSADISPLNLGYVKTVIRSSIRLPLLFLIGHISYWGPIIILLILFPKNFIDFLKNHHFPIIVGFLFTVLFSINPESRPIINFYPFIVAVLVLS